MDAIFKWYVVDTRNGQFVKFTKTNLFSQEVGDIGLATSYETYGAARDMAKFCNDTVWAGAFRATARRFI